MRKAIWAENQPEMQAIHGQNYDQVSRPVGRVSSPTERCALAVGCETETARAWREELQSLRQARINVARVDVWLLGLTEKERKVLTAREIDGSTWPQMAMNSHSIVGFYMTADGLRRIGKAAFEKVCRIAR